MPPKRKAARSQSPNKGGAAAMKKAKLDPVQEKIQIIVDAIEKFEKDPSIKNLLAKSASVSFTAPREDRHKFYNECIVMVESQLSSYLDKFKKEVEALRTQVNNADNLKVENARKRDELTNLLEKEKEKIVAKEDDLEKLAEQVEHTEGEFKKRKKESSKAFDPLEKATKELVEAKEQTQVFTALIEGVVDNKDKEKKKQITSISNYLKGLGKEYVALTASLPSTLQKADRGAFDLTVLDTAAKAFDKNVTRLEELIQTEKHAHGPLLKALADAEKAVTMAEESRGKAQSQLEDLETERERLQTERKGLDKALKDHDKNVHKLAEELTRSTEDHKHLQMVYQTMCELRDRSSKVKEEAAGADVE